MLFMHYEMHAVRHIEALHDARVHFERTHGLFSSHRGLHKSRDANFQQNDAQQEHREHTRQGASPVPKSQPSVLNQPYGSLSVANNHGITSQHRKNSLRQDISHSLRGEGGGLNGIKVLSDIQQHVHSH